MLSSILSSLSPLSNKKSDQSFKKTSPSSSGGFRKHSRVALRFRTTEEDDDDAKRVESFKIVLRLSALYISLKDLFSAQCVSKDWYRCIKHEGVLTEHLWVNAVPISLRHRWWIHASGAAEMMTNRDKQTQDTTTMKTPVDITDVSVFGGSCNLTSEIERDVRRTFPTLPIFQRASSAAQRLLANILFSVARMNPEVGYCQGMNFVAAMMILVALCSSESDGISDARQGEEEDMTRHWSQRSSRRRGICDTLERIGGQPSTQTLQRLYKMCEQESKTSMTRGGGDITYLITALIERPKFKMIGIWSKDVPDLRLRVHQFDVLFETRLPILRKYLMSVGMVPDCYASQWFCTIFAYSLPVGALPRIWDVFMVEGWKALFRIGLALLTIDRDSIMGLGFQEVSQYFRSGACFRSAIRIENSTLRCERIDAICAQVLRIASKISVPEYLLRKAEVSFRAGCVRQAIERHQKQDETRRVHIGSSPRVSERDRKSSNTDFDKAVSKCMKRLLELEDTMHADALVLRRKIEHVSITIKKLKAKWQSCALETRGRRDECARWRRQLANAELRKKRENGFDMVTEMEQGANKALKAYSEAASKSRMAKLEVFEMQQQKDSLSRQLLQLLKQNQHLREIHLEGVYPALVARDRSV
eukprot:g4681.t1